MNILNETGLSRLVTNLKNYFVAKSQIIANVVQNSTDIPTSGAVYTAIENAAGGGTDVGLSIVDGKINVTYGE